MNREEIEHVLRAAAAIAKASKCAAGRDKDADFVRVLLRERLISLGTLLERIALLPVAQEARQAIADWARHRATEAQP